jgi:serine/threonine protein phosphatase PrpC
VKEITMGIRANVFQFLGRKERQEDAYIITAPFVGMKTYAVVGVFDGVSSSREGQFAASLAAAAAHLRFLAGTHARGIEPDLRGLALAAVGYVNDRIVSLRSNKAHAVLPENERPATVGAITVLSSAGEVVVASAGDVLVFLRRADGLFPITEAHIEGGEVSRFFGQTDFHPSVVSGDLDAKGNEALWVMSDGAWQPLLESEFAGDPADFFGKADETLFWDNATAVRISFTAAESEKETSALAEDGPRIAAGGALIPGRRGEER